VDIIAGCGQNIFLLNNLINYLPEASTCTLKKIGNQETKIVWNQGWLSTQDMGLDAIWHQQ
jgi:hypothetical protein